MKGVCFLLILLLAIAPTAVPQEKKIPRSAVPRAVLAAFAKAWPHASINGTAKETEHKTVYYEISSLDGKTKRDLLYAADGTLYETEETIEAGALPEHAREVIARAYPKGKIGATERVTTARAAGYEVHITSGGKPVELTFDDNGNLLTKGTAKKGEVKPGEKKEKDDAEEEDDDDDNR